MPMLYKFRSPTLLSVEMVQRRAFWAALPQSFNDPFDCTCAILDDDDAHTLRVMREFVHDQIDIVRRELAARRRSRFGFSRATMRELIKQFEHSGSSDELMVRLFGRLDKLLPEAWRAFLPTQARRLVEHTLAKIGIVSLSARRESLLLWAHYADSHRGYCLGFDSDELSRNVMCEPVVYSKTFPDVQLNDVDFMRKFKLGQGNRRYHRLADTAATSVPFKDDTLLRVIYSKSAHWSYEQEWRILVEHGGTEFHYPAPLREVIFGLRCPPDIKARVISAARDRGERESVEFFQAEAAPREFGLLFKAEESAA